MVAHRSIVVIIMIMIRFVTRAYPSCWMLKAWIQKHRGEPLLCPGFFYAHYTTHGTYSFTSHPKDEAIMVKCLAQGRKRRDRPGRDSNSHSGNTRTWVQCTRPLGHNTQLCPNFTCPSHFLVVLKKVNINLLCWHHTDIILNVFAYFGTTRTPAASSPAAKTTGHGLVLILIPGTDRVYSAS